VKNDVSRISGILDPLRFLAFSRAEERFERSEILSTSSFDTSDKLLK
jgi:hypothetical protein